MKYILEDTAIKLPIKPATVKPKVWPIKKIKTPNNPDKTIGV